MQTTTNNNSNNTGKTQWNNVEIGCLWKRESKKTGEKYLSGTFKFPDAVSAGADVQVIIFTNKNKKNEGQPDLRVYLSENRNAQAQTPVAKKFSQETVKVTSVTQSQEEELI